VTFLPRIQEYFIFQHPLALLDLLEDGLRGILGFRISQQLPEFVYFLGKLTGFELFLLLFIVELEDSFEVEE
jgi:hypothetical protein